MLIFLIVIGSIALSFWTTFNAKFVIGGEHGKGTWSSTFVLGASFLSSVLYLLITWLVLLWLGYIRFPTNPYFWSALAVTVIINIAFEIIRFKSYALAPLAKVAPFAAISPILTILTSWLIIGELPTLGGAVGIVLIVLSIYFLNIKDGFNWMDISAPFRLIWNDRGTRYAFLSSIPPAISIVFDKKAVVAADPFSFALCATVAIGLGAWIVDLFLQGGAKFFQQFKDIKIIRFLPTGFAYFISHICFTSAFLYDVVPHVSALRRLVIVFEVLLGYLILKQREDIKKRIICALGVVVGIAIIGFFGR